MKDTYEPLELHVVKQQIARHASFSLGKQRILDLTPRFEELWVKRELQRVKEAYQLVVRYGNIPFQGVHDIAQSVEDALKDRTLNEQELFYIADGIRATQRIVKYFKSSEIETPSITELITSFSDYRSIAEDIERCISAAYEVMDQASTHLKGIRKSIRICEQDISKEAQRFIAGHASILMDSITTMRNDRICVLVKISEKNSVDGFIHGESASGQTAYIEPRSLLVLNNKLQSLKSQEKEEITRILFELSQQVKGIGYGLMGNLDTFTLLDCIFAKALWMKKVDGCVAEIDTQEDHLYFKEASHPLIDEQKVVSNTYQIKRPHHCLLITGSNTGGKTVTLKTIGLFVTMTMCGFALSAKEAIVPMYEDVFVDIGDDQSIQESLSTFSSHLSKLSYISKHATAKSLILLDELGSGTDPREGEPLAIAILEDLRKSNAMVIATTHYSALKSYGANNDDILLSSVEFDMEEMRPTYRYIEGISGQSNAFEIARRYGLKESVVEEARRLKEKERSMSDVALEKLETAALENHELKVKLEYRLQDVRALQESLAKEKAEFAHQKDAMLQKVKEDAIKQLEDTKEEASKVLEKLKELKEDAKPHEITELHSKMNALTLEDEEVEENIVESFEVGDYVKLKKLNYYGEILSINKEKVCVFANSMKMNTSIQDITHAQRTKQDKKKQKGYMKRGSISFSMECNVIGMRVAEALPVIDKYLDNAILAKVYQVRIIHGMGTGALRKGVHDFLKHHQRVDSYVMGGQGEGGLGATVVTLKQKGSKKNG